MAEPSALDRLLRTDPHDVGCDSALSALHMYVELVLSGGEDAAQDRYPGLVAHLRSCGPCDDDYQGLLATVRETPGFQRSTPGWQ